VQWRRNSLSIDTPTKGGIRQTNGGVFEPGIATMDNIAVSNESETVPIGGGGWWMDDVQKKRISSIRSGGVLFLFST
jgi:hypothetical protein